MIKKDNCKYTETRTDKKLENTKLRVPLLFICNRDSKIKTNYNYCFWGMFTE